MASVPISLPAFDAQPQENLLQVLNSLSVLESAIANVFGKISHRVQEERNKIQSFDSRIDVARKKVSQLSQSRIAVTVTSPSTFPETPSVVSSKPLFENTPISNNNVEEQKILQVEAAPSSVVPFEVRSVPTVPSASSLLVFESSFNTKRKLKASRRAVPKIETKLISPPASIASSEEEQFRVVDVDDYQPGFVPVPEQNVAANLKLSGIAMDVTYDWKPVAIDYSSIIPSFEELDGLNESPVVTTPTATAPAATMAQVSANANSNDNCILLLNRSEDLAPRPVVQTQQAAVTKEASPILVHSPPAETSHALTHPSRQQVQPVQVRSTEVVRISTPAPQPTAQTQSQITETQLEEQREDIAIPITVFPSTHLPIPPPLDEGLLRVPDRPAGFISAIHTFDRTKLKSVDKEDSGTDVKKSTEAPRPTRAAPPRRMTLQEQLVRAVTDRRLAMESDNEESEDDSAFA